MQCATCGNESCSACGQIFPSPPLHIFWHECICVECQGPPLTEEELSEALSELKGRFHGTTARQ